MLSVPQPLRRADEDGRRHQQGELGAGMYRQTFIEAPAARIHRLYLHSCERRLIYHAPLRLGGPF